MARQVERARPDDVALVFDLDNTLVHSRIDFAAMRAEILEILRRAKVVLPPGAVEGDMAVGELVMLGREHAGRGSALERALWEAVLRYEAEGMREATVEEDALSTLAGLRERGHPLGLLTNNAREATLQVLERFGLTAYLDVVVARDDAVCLKPRPEGVLLAWQRLGNPPRAIVVGDAWIDGRAAALAGAKFIAFRSTPGMMAARAVPVWREIQRLGDLLRLDLTACERGGCARPT